MRERGVVINCTNTDVLRFLPPLVMTEEECDGMAGTLERAWQDAGR